MPTSSDSPPAPRPARRRRRRLLCGAFAFGLLVVVVAEVALRSAGYCTRVAVWYDPAIGFRAHPNQSRWMVGGEDGERIARVHTNALGTRGPLPDEARTDGVLRVVALGDSWTFGIGAPDDQTYPAHLRRALDAEVVNISFPGWSTENYVRAWRALGRAYRPDVVVVAFSMDDMAPADPGVRYTSFAPLRWIGPTGIGQALMRHAIVRLPGYRRLPDEGREALREAWAAQPLQARRRPDVERFRGLWEAAIDRLVELDGEVRAEGARLLILVLPRHDQVRDERAGAARKRDFDLPQRYLAEQLGARDLRFVDLLPALVATPEPPFGEVAHGHPNGHGYAVIARVAAAAIRAE